MAVLRPGSKDNHQTISAIVRGSLVGLRDEEQRGKLGRLLSQGTIGGSGS
jgi:hypothetical protein